MNRLRLTRSVAIGLAAVLLAATRTVSGDIVRDFRAEVSYDDNVSNSDRAADRRDDFSFAALAHVGWFGELARNLRLTLTADAEARAFTEYSDFNHIIIGATGSLRYRIGLGAMAPFVRVEASGGYANFQQDLQDGARYRAGLTIGKRVIDRLALEGSYFYEDIGGKVRLFDRCSHLLAASARWDFSEKTQVSFDYEFRDGAVISYARRPRPDIVPLVNTQGPVETFGPGYEAYNFDAVTHTLGFGLSQALTQSLSVNFRYEWQHTSRAHLTYTGNVLRLSARASF
ncbi:hypothetical protein BH20VER2_BH20VER2_12950 [soil metagenome]